MPEDQSLPNLEKEIREFASVRDWGKFHSPRNLVLALVGEVGELSAEFQWIDDSEVAVALTDLEKHNSIRSEIADVFIYLMRLCDVLGIEPIAAARDKIELNKSRYPINLAHGNSLKYDQYE